MKLKVLTIMMVLSCLMAITAIAGDLPDGSNGNPLRVLMVPADTGSGDITEDYKPVFDAIGKKYNLNFKVMAGESYAAVVQGLCNDQADIAWFGPVTFGEARELCNAELLAVDVKKGKSVYYSGIYTRKGNGLKKLKDLKGHSLAVGSTHSTSSFNYPVAMMIAEGIDPARDLKKIIVAGSHTNSIAALREGRVDACAASFNSWEKAIKKGIIDPKEFKVLAKSEPIPNPPLSMNKKLDAGLKATLKEAFNSIHTIVPAGKIRGYGGKKVDRYDADYPVEKMLSALTKLSAVTPKVKEAIVEKAGER